MIDLTDRQVVAALFQILDSIEIQARASKRRFISANETGRAMAFRLGIDTWQGKTVAKAWKRDRAGLRP
jgi:hypothetical protein